MGRKRPIDEEEEQRLHRAEEADVAPASRPAVTRTSPSAFERAPSFSAFFAKRFSLKEQPLSHQRRMGRGWEHRTQAPHRRRGRTTTAPSRGGDVAPASRPAVTRTSPSAFERAQSFSQPHREKGGKAKSLVHLSRNHLKAQTPAAAASTMRGLLRFPMTSVSPHSHC
jgi:hypothetical protein